MAVTDQSHIEADLLFCVSVALTVGVVRSLVTRPYLTKSFYDP
jgi:hypothetical protein